MVHARKIIEEVIIDKTIEGRYYIILDDLQIHKNNISADDKIYITPDYDDDEVNIYISHVNVMKQLLNIINVKRLRD